jgi:putative CocE/NonD family hydrolase
MRRAVAWVRSFLVALPAAATLAMSPLAAQAGPVHERDVAVPMRDGVVLKADVLRPAGAGPFPVLVYRTPYGKHDALKDYTTFDAAVTRGYAVVVQDVRGRYASDGEFEPYRHEGADGYDTIEWAAAQPWSSGRVGTFGLSYPGAVQWLAAVEAPPHLVAMVPAMTYASPARFIYAGGVWDQSWISWTWLNIAPDVRARKGLPGPRTGRGADSVWAREAARLQSTLPLMALPDLREVAPWYYEWMQHPPADPWWSWADLAGKYGRVRAAVLNVSGWHDDPYGPDGATNNFLGLLAARRSEPDPRTELLIGPWPHGVTTMRRTRVGEREMGAAAAVDYDTLVLGWMDRWLRDKPSAGPRGAPVRVYAMGAGEWHAARTWPLPGTRSDTLYLAPDPGDRRGLLAQRAPRRASASRFVSDPSAPVTDPYADRQGAHDYAALAGRPDVLVFDTPPLERDLDVIGPVLADIYVSTDARDLDLWARVLDVAPDGTAYNLMSPGLDVQRASYRSGTAQRELLVPEQVYRLQLSHLNIGNRFRRGHRIRVQISGAFHPHYSRNLQTGALEMDSARVRRATIAVHHDRRYPSRLVLPVVPAPSAERR